MAIIYRLLHTRPQRLVREVQAAMRLIDRVLELPTLPELPIAFTNEERYGGYRAATEHQERKMELSTRSVTPRLTSVHEFGHFLDDALGMFAVYSSGEAGSAANQVVRVAGQTQAVLALREQERQTTGILSLERFQVLNRLQEEEIWARAFAQYIALRTQNVRLRREISFRRAQEPGVLKNEQWEREDFAPVAAAMDILFTSQGWMR